MTALDGAGEPDDIAVSVSFDVLGTPYPQGSKRAFVANGKAIMTEASGSGHAAWRNAVADKARRAAEIHGCLSGPLRLEVSFRFPMPQSRKKAVRQVGRAFKTSAPDLDKLLRTIGDALKAGGLIGDDAQIASVTAAKYESVEWSGASIRVRQMP